MSGEDVGDVKIENEPLLSPQRYGVTGDGDMGMDTTHGDDLAGSEHNSGFIYDHVARTGGHYSVWTAIAFMVSYGVGAVLAVPTMFYHCGYVLSILVLIWSAFLMYATTIYCGNLAYRAETLVELGLSHGIQKSDFYDNPDYIVNFFTSINNNLHNNITIKTDDIRSRYQLFYRNEYELNNLIGIFCGKKWRYFYQVLYFFLQIAQLWSFVALVGISMSQFIGISSIALSCDITGTNSDTGEDYTYTDNCYCLYVFYCCMFWIWCVCIVLLDFTEQIVIQFTILAFRIVAISIMIITSIGLIYGNLKYDSSNDGYYQIYSSPPHYGSGNTPFDFSSLFSFIMVVMFGFGNQFCVPDIIEPLKRNDRKKQNFIFGVSTIVYFLIFLLTGLTITLYFGDETEDPCSLMWYNFMGFTWSNSRPIFSYVVGWIVVLLPPIDALTAYPLNCITFANTIEQSIFGDKQEAKHGRFSFWKIFIRVAIATVTVSLALVEWNYNLIANIAGFANLLALFFLPAVAEYKSQEMFEKIVVDGQSDNIDSNDNITINETNESSDRNVSQPIINEREKAYVTPITDWSSHKFWIYSTIITAYVAGIGLFVTLIVEAAS